MTIGPQDVFERRYEALFRAKVAPFGEFVLYERDRAARDIGLHLSKPSDGGGQQLTSSLCWFQLKGIQATTLAADEARKKGFVSISLSTEHLRFWYLQASPTWLVLYVESLDAFLILNLQAYVERTFGKSILTLPQKSVVVHVPLTSLLDDHALSLILRAGELPVLARVTNESVGDLSLLQRDASLIWRLGTARERKVEHYVDIVDWQSKLRGEVHFYERPLGTTSWEEIREHWQFRFEAEDIFEVFPYLSFTPTEESADEPWDETDVPELELPDGTIAYGTNASDEYLSFELIPQLNEYGERLFRAITELHARGLLILNTEGSEGTDSAPWHARDV